MNNQLNMTYVEEQIKGLHKLPKNKVTEPKHKKWGGRKRDGVTSKIFKNLLAECKLHSFIGKRNRLVFYLLWLTGCRINELMGFKKNNWQDLIETGRTELYEPKIKQSKTIIITEAKKNLFKTWKWAEEFFFEYPTSPLLRTEKGRPLHNIYAISYYNKLLKEKGLQEGLLLRTHSFRVGLITDLIQTVDCNVAKDVIGHKNILTTLKYNRGTTSTKKKKDALNGVR